MWWWLRCNNNWYTAAQLTPPKHPYLLSAWCEEEAQHKVKRDSRLFLMITLLLLQTFWMWLQGKNQPSVCACKRRRITEHRVLLPLQPGPSGLVCYIQPVTHTHTHNELPGYIEECKLQRMMVPKKNSIQGRTVRLLWMEKKLLAHTIHKSSWMYTHSELRQRQRPSANCDMLNMDTTQEGNKHHKKKNLCPDRGECKSYQWVSKPRWDRSNPDWQASPSPPCQSTRAMTTLLFLYFLPNLKSD